MKNLYKIEDELYVVSNNEDISENCWIIADGRLVQVSYLLSDEIAKGNKVILTTNKLLIKNGIQAIDDEFLEWFVKNSSCESVEIRYTVDFNSKAVIIIPKEEPKQVTLEEVAERLYPEEWDWKEREIFIEGTKWQQERMYSEKEVFELLNAFNKHTLKLQELKLGNSFSVTDWFEQFKKK